MAKSNEREGNSCHIHLSLRGAEGHAGNGRRRPARAVRRWASTFVAGQLAALRELTLLLAPNINSYKRYVPGSFAPTAIKWGVDNRTCAFRLVGHGPALRLENRVPGGDVNPYLAVAAMVAAGLDGIERELAARAGLRRQRLHDRRRHVPATLRDALDLWAESAAGPRQRSATRSSTTTRTWRGSSSTRSSRGHRLGALPRLRAAVSPAS